MVPDGERFDREVLKWLDSGEHRRLLEMNKSDFAAWNPEGRAGHFYMLRGALGHDVAGQLLCYHGSNGTGYATMVFEH